MSSDAPPPVAHAPGSLRSSTPEFQPFVPATEAPREFTLSAVAAGAGLGLIFAASSLYLVLKVGMTVSASIPVAVLAITVFRALSKAFGFRRATILENNIVQTAGSAGESIAFGVGVSMPALLLLGFGLDLGRVMVVSILGGLLGILTMIPLRRAFIVKMHFQPGAKDQKETLLYPEGTACAQVLISGEKGGTTGKTVFIGFGLAFLHKFLTEGMNLFVATVKLPLTFINKAAVFSTEMASELLGVGYIIGLRTAAMMMGGAVLGYLVILPIIYFVGENNPNAIPPGTKAIKDMSLSQIRNAYLLYIGAGCVASAGIISMLKTLPLIVRSFRSSIAGVGGGAGAGKAKRTDRDMPMPWVLGGTVVLIALLALFLAGEVGIVTGLLGALLVVLFGFLFVTVSARLTGEIGSSSNPISGMTTATLMITCLIFLALGMTSSVDRVLALSVAAVVCVASSNGGTVAQSLKTGYIVGGTPRYMQYAIMVGAFVSALAIGGTLIFLLNKPGTVYSAKVENVPPLTLSAPELARLAQSETHDDKPYKIFDTRNDELMKEDDDYKPREEVAKYKPGRYLVEPDTGKVAFLKDDTIMGQLKQRDDGTPVERKFEAPKTQVLGIVINGVLKRDLNWTMVAIGAMIAVMLELCGVSALAFAVGLYVPIQYSVPIFLGGIVRWFVDRKYAAEAAESIKAAGDDPEKKAQAEVEAIRKAETSPGVLLASGYIAGGSIAGVLIAFLAFSDTLPRDLSAFQYRSAAIGGELTLEEGAAAVAARELPNGTAEEKKKLAGEIVGMNEDDLPPQWVKVPKGTMLKMPGAGEERYEVEEDTTLGEIAKEKLGRAWKAAQILDLNKDALKPPEKLPAEAEVSVPQPQWATLIPFGLLVVLLLAVGAGYLLKAQPEPRTPTPAA